MNQHSLQQQLLEISSQLQIDSVHSFRFAGQTFDANDSPWALPAHTLVTPRERLLHLLAMTLYYESYCAGLDGNTIPLGTLSADSEFVEDLSAANQTQNGWERGWQIVSGQVGRTIHVTKGGRFRAATPGEYEVSPEEPLTGADRLVSLKVIREQRDWLPMFYFAHSETLPNQCEDQSNLRFYFHCSARSAIDVIRSVTASLNHYRVPFRMKCLNHRQLYTRSDALVFYIEKRFADFVARCVASLSESSAFKLADKTPLFSRQLINGIGIADDPGDGQSFGQSRCRLLAEGLLDAQESGCLGDDDMISKIAASFRRANLDLMQPHLNSGSVDWLSTYTNTGQCSG